MIKHRSPGLRGKMISGMFIILSLIFYTSVLNGQSPMNFSGTWIQDILKSDDFYKMFNVVCSITQTSQTINIITTFSDEKSAVIATHKNSFNLDGKEVSKTEQGGIENTLATWSPDKKVLTTKSTRGTGKDIVGSTATYSISEDGLILKVKTSDINPEGLTVNQVFNKKK